MTIYGGLAYPHCRRDLGERQAVGKTQINDAPCLRRDVAAYHAVDPCDCLIIGPAVRVVLLIVEKIAVGNALMYIAVADMVKAAVSHRFKQIAASDGDRLTPTEQRSEHIVDYITRKIIVVKQRYRHTVHPLVMRPEKLLYVISVRHTHNKDTHDPQNSPPGRDFLAKNRRICNYLRIKRLFGLLEN